jgi:uncharacterized repeat protein (TIGR03803 family)
MAIVVTFIGPATAQIYTETVLHNFAGPGHGATPYAELIRDPAGNFYGTTYSGGEWGYGVVFKLDSTGKETVLHSFAGNSFAGGFTDGAYPIMGLVRDSKGNLYGTTTHGGAGGIGTVFRIDTHANETILHYFGAEGQACAPLIIDSAGNLYGTTQSPAAGPICGGDLPGTVFKVDGSGNFSILYRFTGGADGGPPAGRLVRDSAGNLYGTTEFGGTSGQGVVFKLDPRGIESVVYSFTGGADGARPQGNLVRDSTGNLYGTAYSGGAYGFGVVFKVDAGGHEAVLHSFTGTDGGGPSSGVIRDPEGNFYGTTSFSTVFKLDTRSNLTVLHTFTGGADGAGPFSGLVLDSVGNLYGTAVGGGTPNFGDGVVYKLDPTGVETVLYSFPVEPDGSSPNPGLIHDSAGNLYGTTAYGGTSNAGSVFRIDASGHEAVLYSFTGGTDGANPRAGLVRDPAGNFYGTTYGGGVGGQGVVFKLDVHGNETVLHSFGGPDGANPTAPLIFDHAGNLYGTTLGGGVNGPMGFPGGVVFKLDTGGNLTVLHFFSGSDGLYPIGGVVLDSKGNLYGTTTSGGQAGSGVVFKIDPSQVETVLFNFTSGIPSAGLIRDPEGNLYGTASTVVFKIDPSGNETVLYSFTGVGTAAVGGLALDQVGNLYGTAAGGSSGLGFVFKLDPAGNLTVLHNFTGGADGNSPAGNVKLDRAGNLYGTTVYGGPQNGGVVFKLTP